MPTRCRPLTQGHSIVPGFTDRLWPPSSWAGHCHDWPCLCEPVVARYTQNHSFPVTATPPIDHVRSLPEKDLAYPVEIPVNSEGGGH